MHVTISSPRLLGSLALLGTGLAAGVALDRFVLPHAAPAPTPGPTPTPSPPTPTPTATPPAAEAGVVRRVVDGDTIQLQDGRTVRLVQIDTPEVYGSAECYGREASAATKALLPVGTAVTLEAEPASDDKDRYGRLLRYVHAGGTNVNLELARRGAAAPYFFNHEHGRYSDQILAAATQAKAGALGLWGACPTAVIDPAHGVSTGPAAPH